jgi:uncharacterized protein YfaP (DUF2135 family)
MKGMRIVLVLVYVLLIILLLLGFLLNACSSCSPRLPNFGGTGRDVTEIGGNGDLKVTLQWDFYADIDLHVEEPGIRGEEIYFSNKRSNYGGELDVDNTDGGPGSAENIFWESDPPSGQYKVTLVYYSEKEDYPANQRQGNCKVTVLAKDQQPQEFNVTMAPPSDTSRKVEVTTINIP